jgi:hypothetical protein
LNGVGTGVGVGGGVVRVGVAVAVTTAVVATTPVGAAATDVGVALEADVVGVVDFGPTMPYRTNSPTMTRIACVRFDLAAHHAVMSHPPPGG